MIATLVPVAAMSAVYIVIFLYVRRSQDRFYQPRSFLTRRKYVHYSALLSGMLLLEAIEFPYSPRFLAENKVRPFPRAGSIGLGLSGKSQTRLRFASRVSTATSSSATSKSAQSSPSLAAASPGLSFSLSMRRVEAVARSLISSHSATLMSTHTRITTMLTYLLAGLCMASSCT